MIISIASGKGGTGKTIIATSLALSLNRPVQYIDCDVEEPNGHIFLKPEIENRLTVGLPVPDVDLQACTHCGQCGEICQYSAILPIKDNVLLFPQLCHGCGGCSLVCPQNAISETDREVGYIEMGCAGDIAFVDGHLRVGETMSPPLIRAVKNLLDRSTTAIIDAPPGTSCPVIEAVKGSDVTLLITEPTPFGLNDLKLAVEMIRALAIPFGVIINRSDIGDSSVTEYCTGEDIPILMEIGDDRRVAEAYSKGIPMVRAASGYPDRFTTLWSGIQERFAS